MPKNTYLTKKEMSEINFKKVTFTFLRTGYYLLIITVLSIEIAGVIINYEPLLAALLIMATLFAGLFLMPVLSRLNTTETNRAKKNIYFLVQILILVSMSLHIGFMFGSLESNHAKEKHENKVSELKKEKESSVFAQEQRESIVKIKKEISEVRSGNLPENFTYIGEEIAALKLRQNKLENEIKRDINAFWQGRTNGLKNSEITSPNGVAGRYNGQPLTTLSKKVFKRFLNLKNNHNNTTKIKSIESQIKRLKKQIEKKKLLSILEDKLLSKEAELFSYLNSKDDVNLIDSYTKIFVLASNFFYEKPTIQEIERLTVLLLFLLAIVFSGFYLFFASEKAKYERDLSGHLNQQQYSIKEYLAKTPFLIQKVAFIATTFALFFIFKVYGMELFLITIGVLLFTLIVFLSDKIFNFVRNKSLEKQKIEPPKRGEEAPAFSIVPTTPTIEEIKPKSRQQSLLIK